VVVEYDGDKRHTHYDGDNDDATTTTNMMEIIELMISGLL